jgi:hypothetical protein
MAQSLRLLKVLSNEELRNGAKYSHLSRRSYFYKIFNKNVIKRGIKMKEINRIVVDLIELRIMKDDQMQWCEIFESDSWRQVSAIELHQLSFNKIVYDWLNQHLNSTDSIQKLPDNKNKSLGLNNEVMNKKTQVSTLTAFLRNYLLNK